MSEKQSRKERKLELRMLEKQLQGGAGVDYSKVSDRHVDDKRFERELEHKISLQKAPYVETQGAETTGPSATYDAFIRMESGIQARTIADRINDPNRVTWDQFKKTNADKLDLGGDELKKMVQYRKELDRDRAQALASRRKDTGSKKKVSSDSDDDSSEDEESGKKRKRSSKKKSSKHKKEKDKRKDKDKKHKKHKKRKHHDSEGSENSSSSADDSGSESEGGTRHKKRKHHKKDKDGKRKDKASAVDADQPVRLSSFLAGSESD